MLPMFANIKLAPSIKIFLHVDQHKWNILLHSSTSMCSSLRQTKPNLDASCTSPKIFMSSVSFHNLKWGLRNSSKHDDMIWEPVRRSMNFHNATEASLGTSKASVTLHKIKQNEKGIKDFAIIYATSTKGASKIVWLLQRCNFSTTIPSFCNIKVS